MSRPRFWSQTRVKPKLKIVRPDSNLSEEKLVLWKEMKDMARSHNGFALVPNSLDKGWKKIKASVAVDTNE